MSSEVRKAAQFLIQSYGKNAAAVALRRAANLRDDQIEGAANTWRKIAKAVSLIEAEEASTQRSSAHG